MPHVISFVVLCGYMPLLCMLLTECLQHNVALPVLAHQMHATCVMVLVDQAAVTV